MLGEFEVKFKDLMGRVGILETKSGRLDTPHFFPVLNPVSGVINTKFMKEQMKCKGIMTNAYLLKKHLQNFNSEVTDIHDYLNFDGIVATDSGAYQILIYGDVEIKNQEIIAFQNNISSDIGVILDVPTGLTYDRLEVEYTVKETIKRADESLKIMDPRTLWIGPIQGGIHRDFLIFSAQEMSKRPFSIYGLGSPTPIMERYLFDKLLEMIMSVKKVVPLSKPLHLFGAGHPMIFPLIVAFGVDTFDSAAYALYAKNGRYITSEGSMKLSELEYFPCSCSQCSRYDPQELKNLDHYERIKVLSEHNLWICFQEIRRIKKAISEGRLWELVHTRSLQHPMLHAAFKTMKKFCIDFERLSPVTKRKGLLIFNYLDSYRPEVVRHIQRFFRRCTSEKTKLVVFCPYFPNINGDIVNRLKKITNECRRQQVRLIYYGYPYGIIPEELDDVYPLGQTTLSLPLDGESREFVSKNIKKYLRKIKIGDYIFIYEPSIVTDDVFEYLKTIPNVTTLNLYMPNMLHDFKIMIKSNFQDDC